MINRKEIINKIILITAKYILIILAFIFYIPGINSNIKLKSFDLISTLLPMIVSTVTIALSLQENDIYGMSNFKFRRLRKGFTFDFIEMIMIVISILLLLLISNLLENSISILYLNIISILYSIWFAIQEIPILTRNDNYLMRVVKRIYKNNLSRNYLKGKDSSGYDFDEILIYLIFNKGLFETYLYLEDKDIDSNINLMEHLLELAIDQMNIYYEEYDNNKNINDMKCYRDTLDDICFLMDNLISVFTNISSVSIKEKLKDSNITTLLAELTSILKKLSIIFNKENYYNDFLLKIIECFNSKGKNHGKE